MSSLVCGSPVSLAMGVEVRPGRSASVGVITKRVDVEAALRVGIVAGQVPADGGGCRLRLLLEDNGPANLGVTTENGNCKRGKSDPVSELVIGEVEECPSRDTGCAADRAEFHQGCFPCQTQKALNQARFAPLHPARATTTKGAARPGRFPARQRKTSAWYNSSPALTILTELVVADCVDSSCELSCECYDGEEEGSGEKREDFKRNKTVVALSHSSCPDRRPLQASRRRLPAPRPGATGVTHQSSSEKGGVARGLATCRKPKQQGFLSRGPTWPFH